MGWSTISQVHNPRIVVEELSAISGDFSRNPVRVLDVSLAKILQYTSQTVIPSLLLLLGLARVGSPELNKKFLTYKDEVSLRTRGG